MERDYINFDKGRTQASDAHQGLIDLARSRSLLPTKSPGDIPLDESFLEKAVRNPWIRLFFLFSAGVPASSLWAACASSPPAVIQESSTPEISLTPYPVEPTPTLIPTATAKAQVPQTEKTEEEINQKAIGMALDLIGRPHRINNPKAGIDTGIDVYYTEGTILGNSYGYGFGFSFKEYPPDFPPDLMNESKSSGSWDVKVMLGRTATALEAGDRKEAIKLLRVSKYVFEQGMDYSEEKLANYLRRAKVESTFGKGNLSRQHYYYLVLAIKMLEDPSRAEEYLPDASIIPLGGLRFNIRKGSLYEIQPGDTVSGIASKFGISSQVLIEFNSLENPDLINPGWHLVIPLTEGPDSSSDT